MGRMKADLSNLWVAMDTGHGRNAQRPSQRVRCSSLRGISLAQCLQNSPAGYSVYSDEVCIPDV